MADETRDTRIGFGGDYEHPDWDEAGRVHDWRNYISQELREAWEGFTLEQKRLIAANADEQAGREEWD